MSYQASVYDAVKMQEVWCRRVVPMLLNWKAARGLDAVRAIVKAQIPVMGHGLNLIN